ncbi:MAG: hypothetical protein K0U59_06660 [Gammaproteobacteria bacterium]|nr:hypothetical protein [Gammaproteobacteria bacterium]
MLKKYASIGLFSSLVVSLSLSSSNISATEALDETVLCDASHLQTGQSITCGDTTITSIAKENNPKTALSSKAIVNSLGGTVSNDLASKIIILDAASASIDPASGSVGQPIRLLSNHSAILFNTGPETIITDFSTGVVIDGSGTDHFTHVSLSSNQVIKIESIRKITKQFEAPNSYVACATTGAFFDRTDKVLVEEDKDCALIKVE